MIKRVLPGVVCILSLGGLATGSEGETKPKETPESVALEVRVGQLEEDIAELRQVIQLLRDQLLSGSKPQNLPASEAALAGPAESTETVAPSVEKNQEPTPDPNTMRLYWSNGIRMDSGDRRVRLAAGGRIMNDWNFHFTDQNTPGVSLDGAEFRRARIYFSGEIGRVEFKAEYDFAGLATSFTDVYVGIGDIPVLGSLKVGRFKEPFGLEELTSSRHITFLERSLGTLAFAPSRNMGFMFSNTALDDRLHWSAGFFKEAVLTNIAVGNGTYAFTGRLAGTPWKESSTRLLHFGAAYSHRDKELETARFGPRPEAHLASRLVDTGFLPADSDDRLGLEAALMYDRFSLQTEFVNTSVDSPQNGDPSFSSFYVQGSLFLTQDSRNYRSGAAAFDRVSPARSLFAGEGGAGAWELAARYSQIDLDSGFILGGKQKDFTLGLNWYLNPSSKFMFNFVHADPEGFGSLRVLQTRFQVDF